MLIFSTFADAIQNYTGLSPAAFFTILALMVAVYRLVCSLFVVPTAAGEAPHVVAAPREPVQLGDVTLEELRAYDGSDQTKPLLMAIKGNIYDVSISRMLYGPGGPYSIFPGRDATRALALMSFDPEDLTSDIEGLSSAELEVLQDWEWKFMEKYPKVGQIVSENKRKDGEETQDANNMVDTNVEPKDKDA